MHVNEFVPTIAADAFSILFGDFEAGYQLMDHAVGFRLLRNPFATYGVVEFYGTLRYVGGSLMDNDAIKILKFEAT